MYKQFQVIQYLTSGSQLSFNAKLADVCKTEKRENRIVNQKKI